MFLRKSSLTPDWPCASLLGTHPEFRWAGIIAAWYLILETLRDLTLIEILSWLGSILGAILAIAVFALSVKYTESKTPVEPESTPLTEKERKYVQSVISRHLEASDEF